MWLIFYIFIVLVTIAFVPANLNDMWWIPKEAIYTLGSLILISSPWLFDNIKTIQFKNKWFFALMVFVGLQFIWNFYAPLIFTDSKPLWNFWNFRPSLNIILGLILIVTLVESTSNFKVWITTAKLLCWLAFIVSAYGILQWFRIDPIFGQSEFNYVSGEPENKIRVITFIGNKFLTSHYIAIISPLCLMFKELRYKIFYAFIIVCVILCDTTSSVLAVMCSLLFFVLLNRNLKIFFGMLIICLLTLILLSSNLRHFFADSGRIDVYTKVVKDMTENSFNIMGNGLGSFPMKFRSGKYIVASAHNEYIQMFYEGFIFLLIICFGYLVTLSRRFLDSYIRTNSMLLIGYGSMFVSFFIVSLFGFPLRVASLALLGIICIASLETQIQGEKYV